MNNILQLCQIFRCHINDLVSDSIIDIDSFDEGIKMNVVKFKKEKQSQMKRLSKAIYIIAKISRVIVIISIPLVVASMILTGIVMNKINVVDNEIRIEGNNILSIEEVENKVSFKVNNITI
jgi:hypothetical protein